MTRHPFLSLLSVASLALASAQGQEPAAENEALDLLSFLNGDFLHGEFVGIDEDGTLRWKHPDVAEPIALETQKLRRIAFQGGRARTPLTSYSYLRMQNGDRIPGEIRGMDDKTIRLATPFAGDLEILRSSVTRLAPNPHGGKVHYYGPFSEDRWTILSPEEDEEEAAPEPEVLPDEEETVEEEEGSGELLEAPWIFSGAAWYSNGVTPLALDAELPDKTLISFNLAWKTRLNAAVAFHANLKVPEVVEDDDEEEEDADDEANIKVRLLQRGRPDQQGGGNAYPLTYGESYVLTLYASYVQLYRCSFDKKGNPKTVRLSSSGSNIRLNETGEAHFELRCDREEAKITLYVNEQFITHWNDPDGYAGTGRHLAFASTKKDAKIRLSDVIATSWNGMIDSALSMESKERDVILLTNGTDRLSGEITSISEGNVALKGTYADLVIPLEDIQEIRLAGNGVVETPVPGERSMRLLLQPVGQITVEAKESSAESLKAILMNGDSLSIDLKQVDIMEFAFGASALDSWNEDF
jgi:hypothetical protein